MRFAYKHWKTVHKKNFNEILNVKRQMKGSFLLIIQKTKQNNF